MQRRLNSVLLIDTANEARQFMFNHCPRGYHTAYTLDGSRATSDGGFYSGPYRNQAVYLQASNEETVRCVVQVVALIEVDGIVLIIVSDQPIKVCWMYDVMYVPRAHVAGSWSGRCSSG